MENERQIDVKQLWASLEDLMIKTVISGESSMNETCQSNLNNSYNAYELFGVDVLFDEFLKPWILEVRTKFIRRPDNWESEGGGAIFVGKYFFEISRFGKDFFRKFKLENNFSWKITLLGKTFCRKLFRRKNKRLENITFETNRFGNLKVKKRFSKQFFVEK